MLVLRLLHIGFGVLWVGAAWMLVAYVQPTMRALGPDVERTFSNYILRRRRLAVTIMVATVITVGAGLAMLVIDIGRFGGLDRWLSTGFGVGITIGATAAIISFLIGPTVILPLANKIEKMTEAGQAADLGRLGDRLRRVLAVDSALLLIAVVFMAIARYL
jgi:uncharacterized membrane protein